MVCIGTLLSSKDNPHCAKRELANEESDAFCKEKEKIKRTHMRVARMDNGCGLLSNFIGIVYHILRSYEVIKKHPNSRMLVHGVGGSVDNLLHNH